MLGEATMIYFLGDVHGNFRHVLEHALENKPDAVVFLGDIEAQRPFQQEIAPLLQGGIDVRWIRGNHDTDSHKNWENLASSMELNIDGQVVELCGVRVAGLGGVFRGEIWYPDRGNSSGNDPHYETYKDYCQTRVSHRPQRLRDEEQIKNSLSRIENLPGISATMLDQIRYGKQLTHLSTIFWDVYAALWEQQADILVTHEAPSCHPHGFTAIDELAQAMGVKAVFHGHHHDSLDYSTWEEKLGFRAYGVGFCGITDENGKRIQSGDFDESRRYRQSALGAS